MSEKMEGAGRRVVLVYWKDRKADAFEVFSNLKIFCEEYPVFNYNTMNNYLSKQKIAYENEHVHVERKTITSVAGRGLRILPVVRKGRLEELKNKQASGRKKDLADIQEIKKEKTLKENSRKKPK